jgi:hypothetical protein
MLVACWVRYKLHVLEDSCNSLPTFLKSFYGVAFEIMVVRHRLKSCWVNGYMNIVCYSDSLQAVLLIRNEVLHYHNFANKIYSI